MLCAGTVYIFSNFFHLRFDNNDYKNFCSFSFFLIALMQRRFFFLSSFIGMVCWCQREYSEYELHWAQRKMKDMFLGVVQLVSLVWCIPARSGCLSKIVGWIWLDRVGGAILTKRRNNIFLYLGMYVFILRIVFLFYIWNNHRPCHFAFVIAIAGAGAIIIIIFIHEWFPPNLKFPVEWFKMFSLCFWGRPQKLNIQQKMKKVNRDERYGSIPG